MTPLKLDPSPKAPLECWSLLQPWERAAASRRTPKGWAKISRSIVSFLRARSGAAGGGAKLQFRFAGFHRSGLPWLVPLAGVLFFASLPNLSGQSWQQALQSEDYLTALGLLDELKQKDPRQALPYLYSVKALVLDGRKHDATAELAAMPFPKDLTGPQLFELAQLLAQLDRQTQAAQLLQSVPDLSILPAESFWFLSELLLDLKQYDDALEVLATYSTRAPNDPRLLLRKGKLQIMAEQLEPALTSFEDAVDARPDEPEAYYEMARTLRFGNNLPAAKRVIAMAIEKKGADPNYLHLQGIIEAAMGEFDDAVASLERARQMDGAPIRVLFDLGNAYRRLGNSEESRAALARYQELFRAEEAEKNRAQSLLQLANQGAQQLQSGDAGAARASFLRTLELDPENEFARSQLIQIYLSSGTLGQARQELSKLRASGSNSAETTFLAAYLNYQERDLGAAAQEAEASRRLRPGNPELRNLLGNIYFAQQRLQEALHEYLAATQLAPDQLAYQANYRSLARKLGK